MSAPLPPSKTALGVTLTLLLVVLLAGCLGGASDADVDDGLPADTNNTSIRNQTNDTQITFPDNVPFDRNSSLHSHDYWQGQQEVVIADGHTVPGFGEGYTTRACMSFSCPPRGAREINIPIDQDAERPKYVYPGTGKVEVELDWSGENNLGVQPVLCMVNSGIDPLTAGCLQWHDENQAFNASHRFSSPGETWTIEDPETVNSRTWDVPHTLKSKWRFMVIAERCGQDARGPLSRRCMPADIDEFALTVTIFRGDENLPLDPPHFDYYQGKSSLVALPSTPLDAQEHFMQGDCVVESPSTDPTTSWYTENLRSQQARPLCSFNAGRLFASFYRTGDGGTPIIPPGTSSAKVTLSWEGSGLPQEVSVYPGYRDAATNWNEGWEPLAACSSSPCTYEIPVTTDQADSLYALRSQWEFAVFADARGDQPAPPWNGISVSMKVTVDKEV